MALERWVTVQEKRGNTVGFQIAQTLLRLFGDVPLDSQFIPEQQLVSSEQEAWFRFLGHKVEISNPPHELFAILLKAREIGWTQAEPHFLPKIKFEQNSDFPGWTIRPKEFSYWQRIREGEIAEDAATLEEGWIIFDGSPKPQYADGKQMYENDPFVRLLTQLRKERKIRVHNWDKYIPKGSRFGVSHDELRNSVNPAIANLLGAQPEQARIPKEIELNALGNLYHRELGETTSSEWFQDKFRGDYRLFGGRSGDGGLADVSYDASSHHCDYIGFRPLVVFPQS